MDYSQYVTPNKIPQGQRSSALYNMLGAISQSLLAPQPRGTSFLSSLGMAANAGAGSLAMQADYYQKMIDEAKDQETRNRLTESQIGKNIAETARLKGPDYADLLTQQKYADLVSANQTWPQTVADMASTNPILQDTGIVSSLLNMGPKTGTEWATSMLDKAEAQKFRASESALAREQRGEHYSEMAALARDRNEISRESLELRRGDSKKEADKDKRFALMVIRQVSNDSARQALAESSTELGTDPEKYHMLYYKYYKQNAIQAQLQYGIELVGKAPAPPPPEKTAKKEPGLFSKLVGAATSAGESALNYLMPEQPPRAQAAPSQGGDIATFRKELSGASKEDAVRGIRERLLAGWSEEAIQEAAKGTKWGTHELDDETAAQILKEAGGDKKKAREIARKRGYKL